MKPNKPISLHLLKKEQLIYAFKSKRNYYAQMFAIYDDLYTRTNEPALIDGMNYCLRVINDNWEAEVKPFYCDTDNIKEADKKMEIKQKLNSEFGMAASKEEERMCDMALVKAIFNSYSYNREFSYMVDLCQDVLERMHGHFTMNNCTYDCDIIYGFLVLMFGDYGISPRSGWIESYKREIISCIEYLIEEYKRMEKLENE